MKSLYPKDIFLSPYLAIQRMNQLVEKYGQQQVFSDGRFKEEREAAITAVFLLGYRLLTPFDYWIGIVHDDPPDTTVVFPKKREEAKGMIKQFFDVEIFEWEEHSSKSLTQAIVEKLKGKNYPKDYFLLCQARRPGETSNLEECYQYLQHDKPAISQIWLVSSIEDANFDHVIASVYPNRIEKRFILSKELDTAKNQVACLREIGRGIADDFEIGNDIVIPLP